MANPSIAPPLLVWLLTQIAALALAAARIPLAANFIAPAERLAIDEMLIVQFAASAMLFPFLLRDVRCCLALMLTSAPMLQLAGMFSATSIGRIAGAWTCVAMWLVALTLWNRVAAVRWRGFAIACANVLAIGGLVLWYLSAESGRNAHWLCALPLVGTIQIAHGNCIILPLCSTSLLSMLLAILLTIQHVPRNASLAR